VNSGRLCAEHLRLWLNRGPPAIAVDERGAEYRVGPKPWREWFDVEGNYLGERSARTEPDVVPRVALP
jgi:hypothetical protein